MALHLFLQSNLSVKDIERHLDGTDSGGEIVETLESPGKGRPSGLSRSMTNIEEKQPDGEVNYDSGCCYSTTSSINDLSKCL